MRLKPEVALHVSSLEHYLLVVIWGGLMEAVQKVLRILLCLGQASVTCNSALRFLWTCVVKVCRKKQLLFDYGLLTLSIKQRRMHSTRVYLHNAYPHSTCYVLAALQIGNVTSRPWRGGDNYQAFLSTTHALVLVTVGGAVDVLPPVSIGRRKE